MSGSSSPEQTPSMTDEALGLELIPDGTPEERSRVVAALSAADRRAYERMIFVASELNAGRTPVGVITTPIR